MELYAINTRVKIASGTLNAIITGINIRANEVVMYECSWWSGNDRKLEWLNSYEVEAVDEYNAGKIKIGFRG